MSRILPRDMLFPDTGAQRWLIKFAKQNHWRVAAWIDLDDLIQEGFLAYYETRKRYPTAVEPSHIQSLFYLVFRSKIENLVRAKAKQLDSPILGPLYEGPKGRNHGVTPGDVVVDLSSSKLEGKAVNIDSPESRMLFANIPSEIQKLLALFDSDKACIELQKPMERRSDGSRETLNERFCKLLGFPMDTDIVSMTKAYFQT